MIFSLGSTSYLLEKNSGWNYLSKEKNLYFSKFGDIFSIKEFKNKKNLIYINLLFVNDLINLGTSKNFEFKKKNFYQILKKLKYNLENTERPIIVGISDYSYNNIIESAQKLKIEKKIKSYFLNEFYKLTKKNKNLYVLDIDEIFSSHGIEKCFDSRNFILSRCRISSLGIEVIAKSLKKIANRIFKSSKKALLLDCDNTLWGGVIAEDGMNKIKIGEEGVGLAFLEFQKAVKRLKDQGILIILLSKNIEADVFKVFKAHSGMALKKKDISAHKINWHEKSKNILKISSDLGLSLDSFVFWDDNPIEREKVKLKLKAVDVIEPDQDVSNWAKQLLEYDGFSKFNITKNDSKRTKQYQTRQKFIDSKANYKNEIDYLKSINIQAKLIDLNKRNIDRAVQMCQRTNQFNFSTKRYIHKDLLKLNKNSKCFMVQLKDIYGDHGIISFICLKIIYKEIILIDTFLMSCRVLGRYLENWILRKIVELAKKNKIKVIIAEFISSGKNNIIKDFLNKNNFKKTSRNNFSKKKILPPKYFVNKKSEFFIYELNNKIENLEIYEKK